IAGGGFVDADQVPLFVRLAKGAEALIDTLATAAFTRVYRVEPSPGVSFLTRESALSALDEGPDLACLYGFGGAGSFALDFEPRLGTLQAEDFLALRNQRSQGHAVFLSGFATVPGRMSVGAALIRAEHGGCVSVLGPTDLELINLSNAYLVTYL